MVSNWYFTYICIVYYIKSFQFGFTIFAFQYFIYEFVELKEVFHHKTGMKLSNSSMWAKITKPCNIKIKNMVFLRSSMILVCSLKVYMDSAWKFIFLFPSSLHHIRVAIYFFISLLFYLLIFVCVDECATIAKLHWLLDDGIILCSCQNVWKSKIKNETLSFLT